MSIHYPASRRSTPARHVSAACTGLALLLMAPMGLASERADSGKLESKQTPASSGLAMQANSVLMRAISLVGTPYLWGGNTPESGFDCSGLVNYVFSDMLNLRLPRTSRELAALSAPAVDTGALATGDLVFFANAGTVTHVGIYVGDGRFIHAPRTGGTVRMEQLDGRYWQARYAGARRVLAGLN
ncbi:MAG: C40 family peptidase [Pseudomonadota bacterium]|nr:C40 family peptidase [Pseudomonadota bacterium]